MCYTQRKLEGGVGVLRESDDTNFLKLNGQSRNLNIYDHATQYLSKKVKIFNILKLIADKTMHKIYHVWLNNNFRDMIYDPTKHS